MAKILVTGGTGFIGERLVRRLVARGDEVTCLVHRRSQRDVLPGVDCRFCGGDVTSAHDMRSVVEGADLVFHLAGATLTLRAREYAHVNTTGTRVIARACAQAARAPVLLFVSSLAAAGPTTADRPLCESDPCAPVSAYGTSKRDAEQALRETSNRVATTVVRPPMVFGPGDPHMLDMFRWARRGWHLIPGSATFRYSLIYVEDLVDVMLLAAENGRRLKADSDTEPLGGDGIYFVAHDEQPSFAELGRLVGQAVGQPNVRMLTVPTVACHALGAATQLLAHCLQRRFLLNQDKMREAVAGSWICSNQRVRDQLGFAPSLSLLDQLRRTADGYREMGLLA